MAIRCATLLALHDVVQANLLAMERAKANGMALNIGRGEPISINDVARVLSGFAGSRSWSRRSRGNIAPATFGIVLRTSASP